MLCRIKKEKGIRVSKEQYYECPIIKCKKTFLNLEQIISHWFDEFRKTIDLIDEMKDGIITINTARGCGINTEAVIAGLKSKKIGALGIDVYENEKGVFFKDRSQDIPNDDNLMLLNTLPNVLKTGHHAFLTDEALTNIAETTIYNLDCYEAGKATENELTEID
ncbi:hypothetical protein G3567_12705 [Psychroflexus sp. YR1-1]|uniref:D-isomer specific 2-hydroxyacid dehydrogenase NAD-binding domain-containing protein n=1 Tax=Psychroflexus aurantiacus TaxID=2709310 RepID=A0A6B3R7D0_9FLAO|nr:NAD(P)-dependent oxidoreductase [Psychroflexus aurantiacus]NEV94997.1 hypothetical protein [Psychroflexus aurantiacus]